VPKIRGMTGKSMKPACRSSSAPAPANHGAARKEADLKYGRAQGATVDEVEDLKEDDGGDRHRLRLS
jgi:hypothetical protein